MNIELTEVEAQAIIVLCDIACKAGGLQHAQNALAIAQKMDIALKAAKEAKAE